MSAKTLAELYAHFVGRTDTLIQNFNAPLPSCPSYSASCASLHRSGQRQLVIRLDHLWAEFCRALVTRSALGNVWTLGRVLLPPVPGVTHPSDVQSIAARESRGPPPWHNTGFTIRIASKLELANYHTLNISIGAVSPIQDLIDIRNYIVHPNQRTTASYLRISNRFGVESSDPVELLVLPQTGGITLFNAWILRLQSIARAAVR